VVGIDTAKTFDLKDLSVEHKAEVLLGMKESESKTDKYVESGQRPRRPRSCRQAAERGSRRPSR
jgi:hypothetical protein